MGLEEALILRYLVVDDAKMVTFGGRLRQRGPEPKLFDVEVLTMESSANSRDVMTTPRSIGTSTGTGGTSSRTSGPTKASPDSAQPCP